MKIIDILINNQFGRADLNNINLSNKINRIDKVKLIKTER